MMIKKRRVVTGEGFDEHKVVSCFNGGGAISRGTNPDGEIWVSEGFSKRKIQRGLEEL